MTSRSGAKAPKPVTFEGGKLKLVGLENAIIGAAHANVETCVITVTEDKLVICMLKHLKHMETRHAWVAPLSTAGSLGMALLTSQFHDVLNVPGVLFQAIFIVTFVVSCVWLFVSLSRRPAARTIPEIVNEVAGRSNAARAASMLSFSRFAAWWTRSGKSV